jgi:uncharacterized protein
VRASDEELVTAEPSTGGTPRASRLAGATSAYLRSAAEQPIDWHPWGPEAFELARRTHRPILLDIGASWCHWCHVMDEGTYADAEVARLLRSHFVAVKVDRDEHPEVDRRYQRQVGALTGEGGWPLTGFLTSDGEVFLGGTYFPPTDGHGRPGFRRLLKEVARLWSEEPERIRESAHQIQGALDRMRSRRAPTVGKLVDFVAAVRADIAGAYDPVHGGFGMAPKFPHPTAVSFLLWDAYANGTASSADRARDTLLRMADGGMYDQVGGGFHRYSVDEGWHIPHFEKMGVDNAALLLAYAEGAQRFPDPRLTEVLRGTVGWVRGTLGDPEGGFAASQDADNAPGDDGNYFTWTKSEIRAALDGDEAKFAIRFFGVGTDGRMHHDPDRNVLFRMLPATSAAEGLPLARDPMTAVDRVIQRLAAARAARPMPGVDRALYADINGRFIAAFARAAPLVADGTVLADARRAADRFLSHAYRPREGVAHRLGPDGGSGFGMLEDQVAFGAGLVELAGATAEPRYATAALDLFETVDREFRGEDGLLRDLAPRLYDGPSVAGLSEPSYPLEDSPHLSANAGAALAWYRLAALVKDDRWRAKADALLPPIAARIGAAGLFAAGSAWAAGLSLTEAATVVVEGAGAAADRLENTARRTWHPNAWVFRGTPPEPFALPDEVRAASNAAGVRALVCFGTSCAPPVTEPAELATLLATPRRTAL